MKVRSLLFSLLCCGLCPANPLLADSLEIREWLVPWKKSLPQDPYVDNTGQVWFVGKKGDFVGNLSPEDGQFNRYDLSSGTGPRSLIIDGDRNIWYASNRENHIGKLSPTTGQTIQIAMPNRKARNLHTMVFDADGNIWFTAQKGGFIGKLRVSDNSVELIKVATRKAKPQGIIVDRDNTPWAAASASNKLLHVFPDTMSITEIVLPNEKSRPRRLVSTANGDIWYADFALGRLGRYRPASREFREWRMPGGADSKPYGMAVDKNDRVWIVETGMQPNRFIGFDTASESFLNETNIPSGAGSVRHMHYYERAGEVWFGTDTNYIGRAKVH